MATQEFLKHRGQIKALESAGSDLYFVTVHPEGQSTGLYVYSPDQEKFEEWQLSSEGGGVALHVSDGKAYIATTDEGIECCDLSSGLSQGFGFSFGAAPTAMTSLSKDRLAVLCGQEVLILAKNSGQELQRFDLAEECTALASSPNGDWLAVGTITGTLAVFESEKKDQFEPGDKQRIHGGQVTALLFDKDELRVLSAGADAKLFMTHVRGRLDPENRGGQNHHQSETTSLLQGPAQDFYSGSEDKSFKTWPGGLNRKAPYTIKEGLGPVVDMALVQYNGRPHLAVACKDSSLRFWDLEDSGRPKQRVLVLRDAMALAKNRLKGKDLGKREECLRDLASYNDVPSLELLAARALDDEAYELRVLATQLLSSTANPRAHTALGQLLSSKDEDVRWEALKGLRGLDGENSLRPLRKALETKQKNIGLAAIEALEELANKDDEALSELVKALETNPSEVRHKALESLEKVHSEQGSEAFLTGLRSSKSDIRRLSLVRLFQREALTEQAVQAALRRHGEDEDADVRQTAFLVSVLSRQTLTQALRERSENLERKIIELETYGQELEPEDLEKLKVSGIKVAPETLTAEDHRPLLQAMASRALDTCLRGATSLALLQDSRAFGSLLQLSREPQAGTRVEVCKALKDLADERGIARLRLMIRDSEASVRDAAFSALLQLESETPLETARAGLMADFKDIRQRALQVLIEQIRQSMPQSKAEESWVLLERALDDSFPEIRSEAFKAALNLDFAGGGEKTLRFVLGSLHRDVRNEVFVEIMAQMKQDWAWPLLLELFSDPDAGLRKEAFNFAMKSAKSKNLEVLSAALDCPYSDLRAEAIKALNHKDEGADGLLFRALDDDNEGVRNLALGTLININSPALSRVMKSKYPDVRVRAAYARALEGDQEALIPLLQLVTEDEPKISDLRRKWLERVQKALDGLAALGSPGALETLKELLKSEDASLRHLAAKAIAACSKPGNVEILLEALRHSDKTVCLEAALGLAACGDMSGSPVIFGGSASADQALSAALALGEKAANHLLSFLDHSNKAVRSRAFLALMLLEMSQPSESSQPERCLAGLSAESPDTRLKSARALENYSDPEAFSSFVIKLFNEREDDKAWEIPADIVLTLGEVLAQGGAPLCYRASQLLIDLGAKKQSTFDHRWARFKRRYSSQIEALKATRAQRAQAGSRPGAEELARLVFGTYVGLSRLQGQNAVSIRQMALRRLFEASQANSNLHDSVKPVFVLALGDSNKAVRKLAFEQLAELTPDAGALCAEALASGQRDVGALGFQKLLESGGDGANELLKQVLTNHDDGLEHEAAQTLSKEIGEVSVFSMALAARSEGLRKEAVRKLSGSYEKDGAEALRSALTTRYRDVRVQAAIELASKKDSAAFETLSELLKSDQQDDQRRAIKALGLLSDERTPALFLDRIDKDPAGTAATSQLFEGVGAARKDSVVDRLVHLMLKNRHRDRAYTALLKISCYDQPVGNDVTEPGWEDKQHPRNDSVLLTLLETCTRLSLENKLTALVAHARWCRSQVVDGALAELVAFPRNKVREAAVEALGWRVRERGTAVDALKKALEHEDGQTRFLAAEGLALAGHKDGLSTLQASVELLPDVNDRKRAVVAIGKLGDEQALDLLLRLINEDGHALQEEAAEALGHMSSSDQADKVFKTLAGLAKGSYGVALSALKGLCWFNTLDSWRIIRDRAGDDSWQVRQHVCQLLVHDTDDSARALLRKRIEEDQDTDVVNSATESLRKLCGEDSLEPDYALICSRYSHLVSEALERLKEKGDPVALLEVLPKVSDENVSSVVEVLLSRHPLPIAEAAKVLNSSSQERSLRIAAQILGRAGEDASAHGDSLVKACSTIQQAWDEQRAQTPDSQAQGTGRAKKRARRSGQSAGGLSQLTDTYCLLLWACGRLKVGGEAFIQACDPRYPVSVRRAALTGLSSGIGGSAGLDALAKAITDSSAEVRSLASSGLRALDPERAASMVSQVLDDRTSLNRLLAGVDNDDTKKALRSAALTVHHQGVALPHLVLRADIEGLSEALKNSELPEAARFGALEGLARIASEEAEDVIAAVAKDDGEEEDFRKAAWRALRRSVRTRKKAAAAQESE